MERCDTPLSQPEQACEDKFTVSADASGPWQNFFRGEVLPGVNPDSLKDATTLPASASSSDVDSESCDSSFEGEEVDIRGWMLRHRNASALQCYRVREAAALFAHSEDWSPTKCNVQRVPLPILNLSALRTPDHAERDHGPGSSIAADSCFVGGSCSLETPEASEIWAPSPPSLSRSSSLYTVAYCAGGCGAPVSSDHPARYISFGELLLSERKSSESGSSICGDRLKKVTFHEEPSL